MSDFERQVRDLSGQVQRLMRDKANLETRNSLLEHVVRIRDEQQAATGQASTDAVSVGGCHVLLALP